MKPIQFLFLVSIVLASTIGCKETNSDYQNWQIYGGSKENIRYSSLTQIDTQTVAQLEKVWEYHTGDAEKNTQIQANPIMVNRTLYGITPKLKLIALDAATGKLKWSFDPYVITEQDVKGAGYFSMNVCRGVTYYQDKDAQLLFYAAGSTLFCVNAVDGSLFTSFGKKGTLDLHEDLGRDVSELYVAMTTPGIIFKDLIIIGSRVNEQANAAPGYIRAYDVHTGKLRWKFHTIPQPGEDGYESWEDKEAWKNVGGVNAWAGFSLDEKRGIVYAPLGSASYDFYGGKRLGDNLFANSILALDAATGKKVWHFQTVHHDVWDRDLPTAPALVTIQKDGKSIDALAQPTKSGFIFLIDRTNGKPIYPVKEIQVPISTELAGEKLAPTQPWPTVMEPFARQSFTEKDINPLISPEEQLEIKTKLQNLSTGFMFNPPSKKGTVIFPGFDGGAEWGGPAYDPSSRILYVNANEMPWILTMVDQKNTAPQKETISAAGERLYRINCMACHGPERKGSGNYPGLMGIEKKYNEDSLTHLLQAGRRMMPAFSQLTKEEIEALNTFILSINSKKDKTYAGPVKKANPYWEMPYNSTGYNKFLTKEGYPAVAPPWGTLTAINLQTGKIVWKNTLGDTPSLKEKGINTGTENYGGPVVTAGGLLFIAATKDGVFRAYNKRTGQLLWEVPLPYPGFATPSIYEVDGQQFIVIACGGGKLGTPSGDAYVGYAIKK
jgi:quinoprotein glucose dehydrogenase